MKHAIIIGSLLLSANAAAQSFDCSKAATSTETMICADPEIAKLDTQMAQQYKSLLSVRSANPNGLIAVQRRWLIEKRNAATAPGALKQVYADRLDYLKFAQECVTSDESEWTTGQRNNCAFIAFDNSDAELGEVYRKMLASPDAERAKEAAALKASQDAWLKFRDLQCTWETFTWEGGNMRPTVEFGCRRALTEGRIKQLQEGR